MLSKMFYFKLYVQIYHEFCLPFETLIIQCTDINCLIANNYKTIVLDKLFDSSKGRVFLPENE